MKAKTKFIIIVSVIVALFIGWITYLVMPKCVHCNSIFAKKYNKYHFCEECYEIHGHVDRYEEEDKTGNFGTYEVKKGANGRYRYQCEKICTESCGNACKTCLMNANSFNREADCCFEYQASSAIGWIGCPDCGDVTHEEWYDWYRRKLGLD